ncbi:putative membrane-associated kinase regulator [Trifolium repens]|nr:putative membrane-associated kinase regulator [Trifolium repens]
MEALTFLKYWKPTQGTPQPTTLPEAATAEQEEDTDDIQITTDDDDEEEPYFDLHFTVPEEEEQEQEQEEANESDSEFRFTISPATNHKVQLELDSSQPNSKPQFTASFLKSATKFRVFMLGLNKSKLSSTAQNPNQQQQQQPESQKKKLFTVKFKVDEVPFVSFFTRDNSSKGKSTANDNKISSKEKKQDNTEEESQSHSPSSEDKISFSKEVMQKYLKKVKPLYVRVSRKYAEKLRFSGQLNTSPVKKPATEKVETEIDTTKNGGNDVKVQKQGTLPLPAGLRVVCKRLGKSRSASSATPSPDATTAVSSRRRDDSIVQQQDGIQSAILHCKSSFNASSKECESSEIESLKKSCLQNGLEVEGGSLN